MNWATSKKYVSKHSAFEMDSRDKPALELCHDLWHLFGVHNEGEQLQSEKFSTSSYFYMRTESLISNMGMLAKHKIM